jgi:uncharacterized membrane protein
MPIQSALRPALSAVPAGLWTVSLLCDLLYLGGAEADLWPRLAFYSMVGGFVAALAAGALPGRSTLTLAVVALYAVNIWLRFADPAEIQAGIVLSVVGVGMLGISSWVAAEPARVHAAATEPPAKPPAPGNR